MAARTYPTGSLPSAAVVQDFNHDGIADLAIANRFSGDISVLLGKANGTFGKATNYPGGAFEIATGDLSGDGNADLAVTDDFGLVSIFLGSAGGRFGTRMDIPVDYDPKGIEMADLNNDGKLDLAVAIHGADEIGEGSVAILLGNGDGSLQSPVYYRAGQNPMRLTVADLNSDGKLDLAVADENCCATNSLAVLLGNGDGTFQVARGSTPGEASGVAAGDMNGDGKLDLVLAGEFGATVRVLIGNGNGNFQPAVNYPTPDSAFLTRLIDLDGDGKLDVLVGGSSGVDVLLGNGDGTLGPAAAFGVGSQFVALGDLNGDQATDAVAGGSSFIGIAFGNGDGTFAAPREFSADNLIDAITSGDFNGDGRSDLALGRQPPGGTVSIALGDGDGGFIQGVIFSDIIPSDAIAADYNGDSKLDLSFTSSGVFVYLGNGDGTFRGQLKTNVPGSPVKQAVGDFNRDGRLDLATANISGQTVSVLLGNGDGTFQPPISYPAGRVPESIVAADFNGDGKLDLAVGNEGSSNVGVYLGNGDGTFQTALMTAVPSPVYMAVADFNHDRKPDLVVSGIATQVLLGNGDGIFQAPQTVLNVTGEVRAADVNGDRRPDILVPSAGLIYVAPGNGDGTFRPAVIFFSGTLVSGHLILDDLNGDRVPDAIVTDAGNHVSPLLNSGRR